MFGPLRRDTFNNKDISKVENKLQSLLEILLIEAIKAYTAINITVIAAAQAELSNNSIKDFKKALALIEGNGNNITEVNAVDKLN